MGGILSNLFSWGTPSPVYDTTPDPGTGLSEMDRHLIQESWALVTDKKTIKENSVEFFMQLFAAYPYMQDYFPLFKGKKSTEVRKNPKMGAHALSAIYALGSFVDNLDDPELLVGLVQKMAISHYNRDIKGKEFEGLQKMFVPYLRSLLGKQCTPQVEEAWGKLLGAQTAIVKQTDDEMSK